MQRKILFLVGGTIVTGVAFATTLSIINTGFVATFHSILHYINP